MLATDKKGGASKLGGTGSQRYHCITVVAQHLEYDLKKFTF